MSRINWDMIRRCCLNASIAKQVTYFALSLTFGVFLLIGTVSYFALRAQIATTIQNNLEAQANVIEILLSHSLAIASEDLATLSRNTFIVNGLVDSQGRDSYLRPFLRDFRLSTAGKANISLTLHDFKGSPLIQVRPEPLASQDTDLVGQAIASGRLQLRITARDNQTYLKLVQPIQFPPTRSVEGALTVDIQLASLLGDTGVALIEGQRLQLHTGSKVIAETGTSPANFVRTEKAFKLGSPFDSLGLRLTLDSSTRLLQGALDQLTLIYALSSLFILPIVGWIAHRGARRLVSPLVQLGATAEAIASSGAITRPPWIIGPLEVKRLASAMDRMLARLNVAQDELEQRVKERTAALETANKELEAFSYSVSHDLRGPLSSIDGFTNLIGKHLGSDPAAQRSRDYLNQIRIAAQRMGSLIDALLSLAHVSRTSLVRSQVDLSMMAENLLSSYRKKQPGRLLRFDVQPALLAHCDRSLLLQALENLLGNALKFCGRKPETLITFSCNIGADGEAVYAVRDNGAGFNMAHSHKLFQAFERLHTQSEFTGTGIGLATVQRIVARHGGRIWAESTPGQGANFYFTLGQRQA